MKPKLSYDKKPHQLHVHHRMLNNSFPLGPLPNSHWAPIAIARGSPEKIVRVGRLRNNWCRRQRWQGRSLTVNQSVNWIVEQSNTQTLSQSSSLHAKTTNNNNNVNTFKTKTIIKRNGSDGCASLDAPASVACAKVATEPRGATATWGPKGSSHSWDQSSKEDIDISDGISGTTR